jgi:PKD repeat protein
VLWHFGDRQVHPGQNVAHEFPDSGTYKVTVTATDPHGASVTRSLLVKVEPNHAPALDIDPTPRSCAFGQPISFSAEAIDPEGEPLYYIWEFGDGIVARTPNPLHIYPRVGRFEAKLTVSDPRGGEARMTIPVHVLPNLEPMVSVSPEPHTGTAPLEVTLNTQASVPEQLPLHYVWHFGDGAVDSVASPTHWYWTAGVFEPMLTVTDGLGRVSKRIARIVIAEPTPSASDYVARINFQSNAFSFPEGYLPDEGEEYSRKRGYGWHGAVEAHQMFVHDDLRRDTFVSVPNSQSAAWELDLDNGSYLVTLVAGSPRGRAQHRVMLQGAVVIDNAYTAAGQFIVLADRPVVVEGGKLRLQLGNLPGSTLATQLCYVDVAAAGGPMPKAAALDPPRIRLMSNPSPSAAIALHLVDDSRVRVDIFDVRGRLVRRLHDGMMPRGDQAILWNGTDNSNRNVESGIYLVRTLVGGERHVLKIAIAR